MLSHNSLQSTSDISSGTGQASSQMNRNAENELINFYSKLKNSKFLFLSQTETDQSQSNYSSSEELINILIKFVNEKERRIQVRPNDTILFLKR